jgi:hypothetical protein
MPKRRSSSTNGRYAEGCPLAEPSGRIGRGTSGPAIDAGRRISEYGIHAVKGDARASVTISCRQWIPTQRAYDAGKPLMKLTDQRPLQCRVRSSAMNGSWAPQHRRDIAGGDAAALLEMMKGERSLLLQLQEEI